MSWTVEEIEKLSYRQLQKLACENGLKGNAKKHDLIDGLTKLLVTGLQTTVHEKDEQIVETPQNNEKMEVDNEQRPNDTFLIGENSLANSTHIVETGNDEAKRKLEEELYLTADEPILSGNLNSTHTLSTDGKENTLQAEEQETEKPLAISAPANIPRPPRSQLPKPNANSGRFVESHKRMFEKMESIVQAQAKLQKNHQKANSNQNINRLATPKHEVRPIQRRFRTPSLPKQENFKFGELPAEQIEQVQKPIPALSSERSPRPLRRITARQPATDVKALTKKPATDSKIVPRSRFDQLSVPKVQGTQPISKQRRSYTPNKVPYRYVDTTKMSNAEFQAYQLQLKQERDQRQNRMVI